MSNFDETTDEVERSGGFIDKDKILEYVSEADIFQLVFGFEPVEYEYITSPFRDDSNPGCWFHVDPNTEKLRFTDFADNRTIKGVKMKNIDCFDAVMIYYNLSSFYKTLDFIKAKLIEGKDIKHDIKHVLPRNQREKKVKNKVKILTSTRNFIIKDKIFWEDRYGVSKDNLIEDMVFPVSKFKLIGTKSGDYLFRETNISYAYTKFKSGNKKLYRPYEKGPKKFITNCTADDVGGMENQIKAGKLLIITKSYKDYRVLKNLGLNVRWLQNEGMFPKEQEFWKLLESFNKIVVFFDNDEPGIKAADTLVDLINFTEINKASKVHLPPDLLAKGISDPSDLYHKMGRQELINFLKYTGIL